MVGSNPNDSSYETLTRLDDRAREESHRVEGVDIMVTQFLQMFVFFFLGGGDFLGPPFCAA